MRGRCPACQAASKRSHTASTRSFASPGNDPSPFSISSFIAVLLPEAADHAKLAFHGARHATQLGGDLLVAVSFHLPHRHFPERVVRQQAEEAPRLLGHLGRELRPRLPPHHLLHAALAPRRPLL